MNKGTLVSRVIVITLVLVALISMGRLGLLDPVLLGRGVVNIGDFTASLFPPNPNVLATVSLAMVETVQIAYVGTIVGFILALPLALLATRTVFGPVVSNGIRLLLAVVRTIPSLLWAMIFVVALGLGPAAGTMGIALYTLGYLGKLCYETFEGVDQEVLEAVKSVGCNRLQLARYALLPEAANNILSQLLFIFEYNVRASTIMGFVGAGGVGFYMMGYIQLLQYNNLLTTLLLTLVVVIVIDWASSMIRGMFFPISTQGAPS